jgi:reactive intermediate/imine deaminase
LDRHPGAALVEYAQTTLNVPVVLMTNAERPDIFTTFSGQEIKVGDVPFLAKGATDFVDRLRDIIRAHSEERPAERSSSPVREIIRKANLVAPVGPYPHASRFGPFMRVGQLIHSSGQGARNPQWTRDGWPIEKVAAKLKTIGIEGQTRQSLTNLKGAIEAAGASFQQLVHVTIFLTHIEYLDAANEVYEQFLREESVDAANAPALTFLEMPRLPVENMLVETEAVAVVGDEQASGRPAKEVISVDGLMPAVMGTSNQVVRAGDLLYTSGQIGIGENGKLVQGGFQAQAWQALKNLETALEAAGSSLDKIVHMNVYLGETLQGTRVEKFRDKIFGMNSAYRHFFKRDFPARSFVGLGKLPKGAMIQFEAVAVVGDAEASFTKTIIQSNALSRPLGPYSHAVRVGNLVYVAGQDAFNPDTGRHERRDIGVQAWQTLMNLKAILETAGSSLGELLKVKVYLANMDDFEAFNKAYQHIVGHDVPARSAVEVSSLPDNTLVQIDAVGSVRDASSLASSPVGGREASSPVGDPRMQPTNLERIKLIVFDLAGTLLNDGISEVVERISDTFGLSKEQARNLLQNGENAVKLRLGGYGSEHYWDYWEYVLREIEQNVGGKTLTAEATEFFEQTRQQQKETLRDWLNDAFKEIPGIQQLLDGLVSRGYKIAVFTNMERERVEYLKEKFMWLRRLDFITSADIGKLKPSSESFDEAFRLLEEANGVTSEEVLYVDDQAVNLEYPRSTNRQVLLTNKENPLSDAPAMLRLIRDNTGAGSSPIGGIDLNPNNLDLRTEGKGMDLNFTFDPRDFDTVPVNGFIPVIFQITPVTNIPMLLGESQEPEQQHLSRLSN